jgi:hypothetical protein
VAAGLSRICRGRRKSRYCTTLVKILFLCPSLELGRDGVGDYTRRLATELQRCGHDCLCVALNDRHCSKSAAIPEPEQSFHFLLRLSSGEPWACRWDKMDAVVREFQPDWLSLQFVPWGLHAKGLPYRLGRKLRAALKSLPVHVMCHELWLDTIFPLPLRQQLLGVAQKIVLKQFFRELRPQLVNTHLEYYRNLLAGIGIKSELLALHGNIPVSGAREEARGWLKERTAIGRDAFVAGFFGNLWQTFDIKMLKELVDESDALGRGICILSAGALAPSGQKNWKAIETELGGHTKVHRLGVLAPEAVSLYLASLDLGLTTYPSLVAGKSAAVASMLEHGVSVKTLGRLRHRAQNAELITPTQGAMVAETAAKFIAGLESAASRPPLYC